MTLLVLSQKSWHFILLIAIALVTGCQSAAYRASSLPSEFRVSSTNNDQNINLAQVASPGASSAVLAPGDLLEITVATGRDEEKITPTLARVADDGTVDVPIIGPVPVANMEAFDASQNIANLGIQRGMYHHPLVTVEIKSKAVNRITVLGAVQEPGVHELPRGGSDLLSALAAAGGLDEEASSEVEIIRQPKFGLASQEVSLPPAAIMQDSSEVKLAAYQSLGRTPTPRPNSQQTPAWQAPQTLRLDLANKNPFNSADYRLNDRDIVRVVSRKKEVIHVTGLVKKPGQFELPHDQKIHLLDAIALAGGRSSPVADKIFVIRQSKNHPGPLMIQASLAKAKKNGAENLLLAAGDTITVEQTPTTAVVDAISKFFRFSLGLANNAVF